MTDISEPNFSEICRLCTANLKDDATGIFEDSDYPNSISNKISTCLRMKIDKNDRLPKYICKECYTKVNEYYSYQESCMQTEIILLRCLENASLSSTQSSISDTTKIEDENIIDDHGIEENNKKNVENNLSDYDMSPGENVDNAITDEEEDDDMEEDKVEAVNTSCQNSVLITAGSNSYVPKLGDPCPDDYVLMKEETFSIDPVKDTGANRGATSSILADYLIEFSNSKTGESESKDKDIVECQKLRREILPPMWDVYERTIPEKFEATIIDGSIEKEKKVTVTHRRYIINKSAFSCSLCGECFEFDQGRKRNDVSEEKAKLYDCQTCGKLFPRRSSWKRHQNTHEDIKPYVCRICNKGFNRKEHLSRHLLSHGSVRPYSCTICTKQFIRKEHLTRHQLCNPSCAVPPDSILRPFTCDVCSQGFVRKEHLQRHRKRAHDLDPPESEMEPKPFTCYICTKTFTRREHLKRHQLIHQRDLTVSCLNSIQSSALNMKQEFPQFLNNEISVFSSTPILPEITLSEVINNSQSQFKSELPEMPQLNHISVLSNNSYMKENMFNNVNKSKEQDYQSIIIKDEDMELDDLVIDEDAEEPLPPIPVLEMSTGEDVTVNQTIDITKSNTFCNVCFKNFSRRSHLLRHMKRIHRMQLPPCSRRKPVPIMKSGDENGNSLTDGEISTQKYNCQQCGKIFSRKSHLERHEKVHQIPGKDEVLPYECVTCGESFLQSKLLDKHMEIHGNTVSNNFVWM